MNLTLGALTVMGLPDFLAVRMALLNRVAPNLSELTFLEYNLLAFLNCDICLLIV